MNDPPAAAVADFLAHKRALGRKYEAEEIILRLLLTCAGMHHVQNLGQITGPFLGESLSSRPRSRARSFNHLVGVTGTCLDWAVTHQRLDSSPLRRVRRRETDVRLPFLFDPAQARRMLEAAAACRTTPEPRHGPATAARAPSSS